jgi:hypothetical protein
MLCSALFQVPEDIATDEGTAQYFMELYPNSVYSAQVIKDIRDMDACRNARKNAYHQLQHFLGAFHVHGQRAIIRVPGKFCGPKVDAIEYWTQELQTLDVQMSLAQHTKLINSNTAVVSFNTLQTTTMVCVTFVHYMHRLPQKLKCYFSPHEQSNTSRSSTVGLTLWRCLMLFLFCCLVVCCVGG